MADTWGTSSNDTHFVNAAWSGSISQPIYGQMDHMTEDEARWQNVNYFEQDYIYKQRGDVEVISSSRRNGTSEAHTDWSDPNYFKNQEIRDQGKGYTYKSYVNLGGNVEGPVDGRPVGRTAYFATSSAGEIIYPSNHWSHVSEDGLRQNFIEGTQFIGNTFLQFDKWEDLSSSSFYSVTVTGEDKLIVQRGKRQVGDDGVTTI